MSLFLLPTPDMSDTQSRPVPGRWPAVLAIPGCALPALKCAVDLCCLTHGVLLGDRGETVGESRSRGGIACRA